MIIHLIHGFWLILLYLWPLPSLLTDVSYSRAVFDDHHQLLRITLSQDEQYRLKTPLSGFTKEIIDATLLQEDQYFQYHGGINPFSLLRAGWQTYAAKERRVGASTITMQVARLRYGIHSKTLGGKLWQILRAMQLEARYSKKDILEAYLNLAPYGNNIQGVGAASLIYFGKSASLLSLPEVLTLAVMPQNPIKRLPDRNQLKKARDNLYLRWVQHHPQDKNKSPVFTLPLQMRNVHDVPFLAPHFVNEILDENAFDSSIQTTLNIKIQKLIEHVTQQYLARKQSLGVNNASVMLVDTRTMEVKALQGSAMFNNAAIQGQINGTKIKRSPGSTLKPFIYALAIDQGLIHPNTVLKDVSHSFGSYNPENFDNDFAGPIKAKDALVLSRNIPAIFLANQLAQPNLYQFLQQANISNLKSERYYGLALVLGGAELSMQELVGLYSVLVNKGEWQPIRFTQHQETGISKKLLSPEASFLVLDMLKEEGGMISFKTGTSSGFRDAWTIGVVGPYVLAVWIGNFNNDGNPAFVGKTIASPLFFEIANALNKQIGPLKELPQHPENLSLTKVDVCKASGMLPNHVCPETENVWFIPGKSPITVDTVHREVAINVKTGLRACQFDKNTQFEVYEFWSSDLLEVYRKAGMERRVPPAFDSSCKEIKTPNQGLSPQIASPQADVQYIARLSNESITIPLTAVVDADVNNMYWFVNANFIGKATRDKPFLWKPKPGYYTIRVVDDYGRSDARMVNIVLN